MEYAWSVNEEDYHGSEATREAAVQAAIGDNDLEPGRKVWTGEAVKRSAGYYLTSADRLLEDMQERAYEHHGEYSEDWLTKVSSEQERELDLDLKAAVDAWAEKYGHRPFFYEVSNTVEHEVTAAHMDDRDEN